MNRRHLLGLATLGLAAARGAGASAAPPELAAALPAARLQGQGDLRYLGLRIYEARLWVDGATAGVADGASWTSAPLALEISYQRSLQGSRIAERSLQEMRRQGEIDEPQAADWLRTLRALLPDVRAGDRLTALHRPGQRLQLYANGRLHGETEGDEFARRFLGIWLAPQTSEPALRRALLGRSAP